MNRFKKISAIILSTVITVVSIPAFSAEAWYQETDLIDRFNFDKGYTEFESTELFQNNKEYFEQDLSEWQIIIRSPDDPLLFNVIYNLAFSHLSITVKDDSWRDIYDKYSEALNINTVSEAAGNAAVIRFADYVPGGFGSADSVTNETVLELYQTLDAKLEIYKEMTAEMYAAGCIEKAEYFPVSGPGEPLIADRFKVTAFTCTEDELKAAMADINENITVSITSSAGGPAATVKFIYAGASAEELFAAVDAIEALDSSAEISVNMFAHDEGDYESSYLSTETVDLLAPIKEAESCDINKNGTPDLDDAVLVLTSYANTAAGIETAADTVSCDVNGDGAVDLDDAVKVLTVYAELAAGLR